MTSSIKCILARYEHGRWISNTLVFRQREWERLRSSRPISEQSPIKDRK